MINKNGLITRGSTFLVTAFFLLAFILPVMAAPVTATTTVPAGQTSFSIDLRVNEPTAYAGIEFALTVSNESAVTFASFTPKISGAAASPFRTEGALHYFGFLAGSNAFSAGDTLAGTLNFTDYTGSQPLTVTVTQMNVIRIVDNKAVTTVNESPAYVFTVQRAGAVTNYTVTFDPADGTRSGGGALVQTIPAGGAAVAPIVARAGYTFSGWDKAFDNVTADMTVTAIWIVETEPGCVADIRADEVNAVVNAAVGCTVSLTGVENANLVTLSFTFDSEYLNLNSFDLYKALNGFMLLDIVLTNLGNNLWEGTLKLIYTGEGGIISSEGQLDILKIAGKAKNVVGSATVTLTDISVIGQNAEGNAAYLPCGINTSAAVINIVAVQPSYTVTFDPTGGTRTSGGALVQTVSSGGAAVAPIVIRSGYTFDGWDKPFNNITADITVTAIWIAGTATNYTVTFDPTGGTRTSGGALVQTVSPGGAAVAPIVIRGGYTFDGWDKPFNNISSHITVTAIWVAETITNYMVTFDPAGGTRTTGGALIQTIPAGGAAVAPVVIRSGYTHNGWDKAFNNVTADITVTAIWTSSNAGPGSGGGSGGSGGGSLPSGETVTILDEDTPLADVFHYFDDVDETHYSWALEAVDTLAEAGVVKGTSERIYSPALSIKRGDFTLMLVRAYKINDAFTENFPDVPEGSYYYDAIGSAKARGVAKGFDDGHFRPEDPITRQDMMVLIDRTLQVIGKTLPRGSESDLGIFEDRDMISDYARESIMALVKSGIIQGDGSKVNPQGYTTRAEMAVALYRLLNTTA